MWVRFDEFEESSAFIALLFLASRAERPVQAKVDHGLPDHDAIQQDYRRDWVSKIKYRFILIHSD